MQRASRLRSLGALACLLAFSPAVLGAPGFGQKQPTIAALKEDIKFVECEMCEALSKHMHGTIKGMRDALHSWEHLTEVAIFDKLELMCNPRKTGEGDWLAKLDIQEDGDRLRVVEMPGVRSLGALTAGEQASVCAMHLAPVRKPKTAAHSACTDTLSYPYSTAGTPPVCPCCVPPPRAGLSADAVADRHQHADRVALAQHHAVHRSMRSKFSSAQQAHRQAHQSQDVAGTA